MLPGYFHLGDTTHHTHHRQFASPLLEVRAPAFTCTPGVALARARRSTAGGTAPVENELSATRRPAIPIRAARRRRRGGDSVVRRRAPRPDLHLHENFPRAAGLQRRRIGRSREERTRGRGEPTATGRRRAALSLTLSALSVCPSLAPRFVDRRSVFVQLLLVVSQRTTTQKEGTSCLKM